MRGDLSGHIDAYKIDRFCIDTKGFDVHKLPEPAKNPVGEKLRILWGKDYFVKYYILEHESNDHQHKYGNDRSYYMPPQFL